jgi:hypothetical protein
MLLKLADTENAPLRFVAGSDRLAALNDLQPNEK